MEWAQAILGLGVFSAFAWAISERRKDAPWRIMAICIVLQFALAFVLLKIPPVTHTLLLLNDLVDALQSATRAGTSFVFGYLGGGDAPFNATTPAANFILAFQALPLVLLVSALSAVLYHWRILPKIVGAFAWVLGKTTGVGGPAGVGTAANIFVGMVEAPLLIKPYLARLSRADLFVVMTAGMATIAGTMMALYAFLLKGVIDAPATHLFVASILSAPAAVGLARLMVPPDPSAAKTDDEGSSPALLKSNYAGTMDAITRGTLDGLALLLNIIAMLVVLVALVALVNGALGLIGPVGEGVITLQRVFGYILAPVAWLMGLSWGEAMTGGSLLGIKVVLTELLAFVELQSVGDTLSGRSRIILSYGLCGFASFGSLGIMIGGLAAMVPDRRAEIAALGLKSVLAGLLATCMTGAVVGLVL